MESSEEILDSLKLKFDTVKISEIETFCMFAFSDSQERRKNLILGLYYLERTKRYKENTVYKNSSFETYINNVFNLRYATYNKERFAYIAFPNHATKWGAGLVDKVKRLCGIDKVENIFESIDKIKNVNHNQIENIINKNKIIKKIKTEKITKQFLEAENMRKDNVIASQQQIIEDQTRQIMQLMRTIEKLKSSEALLKRRFQTNENHININRQYI